MKTTPFISSLKRYSALADKFCNDAKPYFLAGLLGDASKLTELDFKNSHGNEEAYFEGVAYSGHMELVNLLLEKGADPNKGIEAAARGGHTELVNLLLEKGADPNKCLWVTAEYGRMEGLPGAAWEGHVEIVKLMLAQPGIKVNEKGRYGKTPLDCAIESGHHDCAELIRAAGGKRRWIIMRLLGC